ncbi:MAG: GNAT family N-acetyltransferase [Chitinophagaceae bacterium]|nr:GNAT family N-acetyltransferase [Chitinophagaceae bacterium]
MLTVKKASVKDIELIRQLTFSIWPDTYSNIISKEQIDYMLDMMYSPASLQKQLTEDDCTFIITYDDDKPVAFASYNEIELQVWKLNKLYILSNQQGKGIGRYMINYIVTEIQKQDAKTLQLQVNKQNPAKYFYEKIGFTVAKDFVFDIGNGFVMDDYIMELVLN